MMRHKLSFTEVMLFETEKSMSLDVTEAGSGVVSEQRNRLVATIKFIYAGEFNL